MKKLIIFDFDGVLVDSEIIDSRVYSEMLSKFGYNISAEGVIQKFTGVCTDQMKKIIFEESGIIMSDDLNSSIKLRVIEAFENELRHLNYDLLENIVSRGIRKCIASNSKRSRIIKSLKITNQDHLFTEDCIFNAEQVSRGKPYPDLFLFAAEKMGFSLEDCLVIEDSVAGIKAAKSAGMEVIGFLGGSHAGFDWYRERIQALDVPIVYNSEELNSMIDKKF